MQRCSRQSNGCTWWRSAKRRTGTATEATHFRAQIERYAHERQGFRLAVAGSGDRPVGVVLAVTGRPGDWWRDRVADTLGTSDAARWCGERCSEIVTLAVDPAHRRLGVARQLLAAIGDRAAADGLRTAVLGCRLDAAAPWAAYQHLGWTVVSRELVTRDGGPRFGVLARDL